MISIKPSKSKLVCAIFGCFFGILGLILPFFANSNVYAEPSPVTEQTIDLPNETLREVTDEDRNAANQNTTTTTTTTDITSQKTRTCDDSLGSLGWLVCPTTGKISEAVDWLYAKNKEILEINPIKVDEESPIYQVWNYFLGVANIAFVIFLLIVVYSQITGVGISNYGIKKALPKLIIAAIMVNLSFILCSLAVDVSNIIGNGLRGIFTAIEEATIPAALAEGTASAANDLAMAELYSGLAAGGGVLTAAGIVLFEGGEIWLLIPAALAALIAVAVGLVTIALRQAVVILLIMIAPLAIVAYIMPNTEKWFTKWKDLLIKMLVFYPMYSLLFGASSLAGWAIISSSQDGFGMILGTAVKIFPLIFSWSLMKMSGTFLGTVNAKITGLFAKPLATNRAWAESHRELTRQNFLASTNVYSPSLRLRQFLSDRKIAREEETKELAETVRNRGLSYGVGQLKDKYGRPTRAGVEAYERQARNMRYKHEIERNKNDFNKGLGQLEVVKNSENYKYKGVLDQLDTENMLAADALVAESARGELIDYNNAKSRHERMQDALDAHMDAMNGRKSVELVNGLKVRIPRADYKYHFKDADAYKNALANYSLMSDIMEGVASDTQYAIANAAQGYETNKKVYESKMQKLFDYTEPTQDVMYRLNELNKGRSALSNIDALIAGMRVLNQRGDTDLVKAQLDQVLSHGVELGTHASQALASFLMFEVKDNDPFLRRFGKYINLETARVYNANSSHPEEMRKELNVNYEEYMKGYHVEPDGKRMYAKKDINKLVEGTSLDSVERTAFSNLDESLKKAYGYDGTGKAWDYEGYIRRREAIQTAMEPAFLSASLKWLSGSEQMNSAVKFWTGYELKQKKNKDGSPMLDDHDDPIYELNPVWEDKAFKGHKEDAEKYFRRKTMDYFKDQTTSQILNLRTDYRDPAVEHLVSQYFADHKDERKAYEEKLKAITNEVYDKNDSDKDRKARASAIALYKRQFAGAQLRDILGKTGKLEQIYNMKRSGATANMKDWLRSMIHLDDPDRMREDVAYYSEQRKKANAENNDNTSDVSTYGDPIFDANTRAYYADVIDKFWSDFQDDPEYFEKSMEKLNSLIGRSDYIIKRKYAEFHNNHPSAGPYELRNELQDLLLDERNYKA